MNRHIVKAIFFALTTILLSGCSHNNGGDSRFWGTWKLVSITIDDVEDPSYSDNYFWKFQGDVVFIQCVDDFLHQRTDYVGTWFVDDSMHTLTLEYFHRDNEHEPGTGAYAPPTEIYISDPVTALSIVSRQSNSMVLSHIAKEGKIVYYLERW